MANDSMRRYDPNGYGPFAWMREMQDQVDKALTNLWGGSTSPQRGNMFSTDWSPDVDVFQRGNELVVRADVPGLSKEDVTVDIADDRMTIKGERRFEHEEERDGVYATERSYGSFCRVIPLPPGAIVDSAKATFHNGVLEITMEAPSADVRRGRRLEIKEGASKKPESKGQTTPQGPKA